jgi:hypothetical protein
MVFGSREVALRAVEEPAKGTTVSLPRKRLAISTPEGRPMILDRAEWSIFT